jgi:hypothetical protein
LLSGRALDWYRVYGYQFKVWQLFVERLKEEFLPADFDHRVAEEIRHTKQQENETFQEFCVRIELVFMKRLRQMTEEEKVEHIKHNMLKIYKTPDVARLRTINDLRDACRYVDSIHDRVEESKPKAEKPAPYRPPRVYAVQEHESPNAFYEAACYEPSLHEERVTTAEDLQNEVCAVNQSWRNQQQPSNPQNWRNFQQSRPNFAQNRSSAPQNRPQFQQERPIYCYNCRASGHYASQCTQPKQPQCFKCRAIGVTFTECGNCSPKPSAPMQEAQGNATRTQ